MVFFFPGDDVLHLSRCCRGWRFKERSALANGILYATEYPHWYHYWNEWSFDRHHWGKTSEDEDYPKHLWHVWDNILDQLVNILWNHCIPLSVHHLHLLVCHYPGLAHRELCHLLHHPCIRICTDFIARDLASFWVSAPLVGHPQNAPVKNLRDPLGRGITHKQYTKIYGKK